MAIANKIWKQHILDNWEEQTQAGHSIQAYLESTRLAKSEGGCVKTLLLPKVFTWEDIERFQEIVSTMNQILVKVTTRFQQDADYRKLFGMTPAIEAFVCEGPGYDSVIPMMRMDIFYDEETKAFRFCEVNTDGSSGMVEDLYLRNGLQREHSLILPDKLEHFELFDTWIDTILEIYDEYRTHNGAAPVGPRIAIMDFLEAGYLPEFEVFEERFRKRGYAVEICDIRAVTYENGKLYSKHSKQEINLIYRRAVTHDIEAHMAEVQPFLQAVKDKAVCLVGGLQTQVAHHKMLFYALHRPETYSFLTKNEIKFVKAHVPYTTTIKEANIETVVQHKDNYILKPYDGYASHGVYAGCGYEQSQWNAIVAACAKQDYIVQEYCTPYCTWNVDCTGEQPVADLYQNMTGLFAYNGKFAGILSRQSNGAIIATNQNERALTTFYMKESP